MVLCQHGGRSNQKPKRPTHHHHNHHHRENTPKARLGPQGPESLPLKLLPERSLRWETGDPLPWHPRGFQRRWSPEDVLEPPASSPGEQALPTPEGREAPRNTGNAPFSTLRCCVPELPGSSGLPGTPGRGPRSRDPPASFSPGRRPEGAASPASRTTLARRAGVRSASARPAPPRPPSCADATRPRPLAPLPPRPGAAANGDAGAGRADGSPKESKGCGQRAAGVLLSRPSGWRLCANWESTGTTPLSGFRALQAPATARLQSAL